MGIWLTSDSPRHVCRLPSVMQVSPLYRWPAYPLHMTIPLPVWTTRRFERASASKTTYEISQERRNTKDDRSPSYCSSCTMPLLLVKKSLHPLSVHLPVHRDGQEKRPFAGYPARYLKYRAILLRLLASRATDRMRRISSFDDCALYLYSTDGGCDTE